MWRERKFAPDGGMAGKNYAHSTEGQWEGGERRGAQIESNGWEFRGDGADDGRDNSEEKGEEEGRTR